MVEQSEQRRLAAIFSADMVGYSRLMEADERGTIARQKAHRAELIDPKIAEHHGRIVKLMGDGMLVEFASVVDAVECAMAVQQAMVAREEGVAEDRRIQYRVGINLGDIVIDGDDIYGDGVNIAARLEGLAEPGGVCISRAARDQIRDKLDYPLDDLGEVEVKNIARPVRVFRVLPEGEKAKGPKRQTASWLKYAVTAVVVLAIVSGGGIWWWQQPDFKPADPAKYAFKLPEKPSIAVLPFDNLTGDKAQDFISDGLTENIITALSYTPNLFVIARNSSFTYKNKATKVQKVAEELGVRYLLEGSVQRTGDRIRVTAQLIDAVGGQHLWSERYDRELTDLFKVQDEITGKIFVQIGVKLTRGEVENSTNELSGDLEAFRLYYQGHGNYQKFSKEGHVAAEKMYLALAKRQPETAMANILMGWLHWQKWRIGLSKDGKSDLAIARKYAEKALTIKQHPGAFALLAPLDLYERKYESAIANVDRALELSPAHAVANSVGGWIKFASGQPSEGVKLLKQTMRFEPYFPPWVAFNLSFAYMHLGEFEEAKRIDEGLLASTNVKDVRTHPRVLGHLAAVAVFEGDLNKARDYANRLLKMKPNFNIAGYSRGYAFNKDQAFLARYYDALRKAGLPENPPLKLPEKPSIAVLPFQNMSGDTAQTYFADGMAEDIITDLSKLSGLFVIARNSSFQYRGGDLDLKKVGRELGVKYLLEGSVRRAGDQVRINAQLIDAQTGGHVWADRYDGTLANVFKLQDQVTAKVVEAMSVTLTAGERALAEQSETTIPEAYDAFLTGWRHFKLRTIDDYRIANTWFEKALMLDTEYGHAWAALASLYQESAQRAWAKKVGIDTGRFPKLLEEALQHPTSLAYQVQAEYLMFERKWDEAASTLERASALDANHPDTFFLKASLASILGDSDKAIALMKTAMRLDPHYPAFNIQTLGRIYLKAGDLPKAIEFLERGHKRNPEQWTVLVYLVVAYAEVNRLDDAKHAVSKLIGHRKKLGFQITVSGSFSYWWTLNGEFAKRVRNGLRKVGLSDKAKPEDLNLKPENRLSEAELRARGKMRFRAKGRMPGGVWMRDNFGDGNSVHYWLERKSGTSVSEVRGDTVYRKRASGREYTCAVYKNRKGSNENMNEFIGVCTHGVYPHALFPIPGTAQ
jgi:adenylate cyclase